MLRKFYGLLLGIAVLAIFMVLWFCTPAGYGQITNASTVDFATGSYQVTDGNESGSALNWSGWNLAKKSSLNKPIRARVIVESISGLSATFNYTVNYFGTVYSNRHTGPKYAAFWIPDSAAIDNSRVPDSLFYIVPDSTGMSAGDEFFIASSKIGKGDQYVSRLIYSTGSINGTASLSSQPIWIGNGVESCVFAFNPDEQVAAVYRALYATRYDGTYTAFISSDTLADSLWTRSAAADAYAYKAVTGIDNMPWMKVQRIGKVEADSAGVWGETVTIQSK